MKGFTRIVLVFLVVIIALFFLTKQCGNATSPALQTIENYEQDTSHIIIPLQLDIASFEKTFNSQMDEMGWFLEEADMDINRNLSIAYRVKKSGRAQLYPENGSIKIEIPLFIDIRPQISSSLSLGFGRDLQLQSRVNLRSDVAVDIDKNWELISDATTEIEVVESPELNVAGFRIQFGEQLKNNLALSADEINQQVEDQVKEAINTKEIVQAIWQELQTPYEISGEHFQAWATVQPLQATISDLLPHQPGVMSTVIELPSLISIETGGKPSFNGNQKLPQANRKQESSKNNSLFLFPLKIPFETFLSYLNSLENIPFEIQNRQIVLSNFVAENEEGNLIVTADFETGDTNGRLSLVGVPVFDQEEQSIQINLKEIKSESNNKVIDRLVNSMQKSRSIRKKIENNLEYQLKDDLATLNFTITKQLKNTRFNEYAELDGYLDHITIRNIYVGEDHLLLDTEIEAQTVCVVQAN